MLSRDQYTASSESYHSCLIDNFGRKINYLRISVTDKCNLRCFYCMPKGHKEFEEPENWLSFSEIKHVVRAFSDLGVANFRITGGEPLVRKNISKLVKSLNSVSAVSNISLSTNASLLASQAVDLHAAGIDRINVSLDTLNQKRFRDITGGSLLDVYNGLDTAKKLGFSSIKINMVVMKGVNDDEIRNMLLFCQKNNFVLRLIETMPMGSTGQNAAQHYLDLSVIRKQLKEEFDLVDAVVEGVGPARYMKSKNSDFYIGFITPISQHFCETCNRVRMTVDGTLHMCLGQEHSFALRPLLRAGISHEELKHAIVQAINLKPEKHEFNERPQQTIRFMSMTGG
jgi:cyclic pyranopterin phosphate synthase